jgi:hypothetical protein
MPAAVTAAPPPAAPAGAAGPLRRGCVGAVAGFVGGRLAARTGRRFQALGDGVAAQHATYRGLMAQLAGTGFARRNGLSRDLDYGIFARRVAPRTYEDFAADLQCMARGERDVLCPGRCGHFAVSSGTTEGPSKWLPVNRPMLAHFRRAGLDALALFAQRTGRASVFRGRHLFLGGSTALVPVPGVTPPVYSGDLSGIAALNLPAWVERLLYEPGVEIAQMTDWPAKLAAIARRTLAADITLVAGIPSWLLILAEALRAHAGAVRGRAPATVRELWPHLECLVHGGVPVAPFAAGLRAAFGAGVTLHEVYPASEAFVAAQDAEPEAGLRLLADHGVFYEFLPWADYDERALAGAAGRVVPLEGVRSGEDYVLLLTTPAGLVRYVIGDVVRFVGTHPPRLVYVGRTRLQLSAFGEHVIEKDLTDALATVGRRHGMTVANFHVAPQFAEPAAGRARGRHEWWIEPRGDVCPILAQPGILATALDRDLAARNDDYAAKREGRGLDEPVVRLVRAGVFEHWLRTKGKWGGQNKMPRCRSDRRIADELAVLAGEAARREREFTET